MEPSERVVVECFALRLAPSDGDRGDPGLVARYVRGSQEGHPDLRAAQLLGLVDSSLDGIALLHSTSWRWDPAVGLILTYLCCPDPHPTMDGRIVPVAERHGDGDDNPSRPHQLQVELSDVLHHGVDHLAWLSDHHPHLTDGVRRVSPSLLDRIRLAGRHRAMQVVIAPDTDPRAAPVLLT